MSSPPSSSAALSRPAAPPRRWRLWLVLGAVVALLGLLALGMTHDPRALPSVLIGKPWPAVALPQLDPPTPMHPTQWRGQARVINLWASWCGTCREEHDTLMALAATLRTQGRADQLIGLNYKDAHADATRWLQRLGNPYGMHIVDADGRMAIELGVYGAPETFVIDAQGIIVWKHAGALTPALVETQVMPRLNGALR
jgi:cytochrome c biogenesis protein CcmG, thiol:disulfide interchange protein DsbE